MRTFALFVANKSGFFEIYGVSARIRGRLGGHFSDREEGSFFRNFVQTYFMDGPLPV